MLRAWTARFCMFRQFSLLVTPIRLPIAWLFLVCIVVGAPHVCLAQGAAAPKLPTTIDRLSFDPQQAEHWALVRDRLQLSPAEVAMFARQGLVVVGREHPSFAHAYDSLYRADLPLLITSDSILYVVHASLDKTLSDLEEHVLAPELAAILQAAHAELDRRQVPANSSWFANYRDVDLYLTVGRRLLGEAVGSSMNQDGSVNEILRRIAGRKLEHPLFPGTPIYGSQRHVDYSQFQPRGHYTQSQRLQQYFLAMMWLGRADCGWFVTPASYGSGVHVDVERELRDSVLMVDLLTVAGKMPQLEAVEGTIRHFMGDSDNITPSRLSMLMAQVGVARLADLSDAGKELDLKKALEKSGAATQRISSQSFFGARAGPQASPPGLFQVLGNRFAIDSWVLANVVFDTVQTQSPRWGLRKMPRGLDVMAALGNVRAKELLADDLREWRYEPQLQQATDVASRHLSAVTDQSSIYDLWLSTLPTLHADLSAQHFFPEVMQTRPWQLKQLHTELGSWAELRHAGILYVKQSYTRNEECDYPAGYVEPYPEFYAGIARLAGQTAQRLSNLGQQLDVLKRWTPDTRFAREKLPIMIARWSFTARTMRTLETLARKELRGESFTVEETKFLKDTATFREEHQKDSSGRKTSRTMRDFTGWYGQMLYPASDGFLSLKPCVADVHTNGDNGEVLEVGVGLTNFVVAAINSGADRRVYVGPVYTYYEFRHPVSDRLTDESFGKMLQSAQPPPRPEWTAAFRTPADKVLPKK